MNKKLIALFTAAGLLFCAPGTAVYAEETPQAVVYSDPLLTFSNILNKQHYIEKGEDSLETVLSAIGDIYGAVLSAYKDGGSAEISVSFSLGDTGKAVLNELMQQAYLSTLFRQIVGYSMEWINDVQISDHITMEGWTQYHTIDLIINQSAAVTLECYLEPDSMDLYFRIPTLSERYLKTNLNYLSGTDVTEIADFTDEVADFLPSRSELQKILNEYGEYFFEHSVVGNSTYNRYHEGKRTIQINNQEIEATFIRASATDWVNRYGIYDLYNKLLVDEQLVDLYLLWDRKPEDYGYDEFLTSTLRQFQRLLNQSDVPDSILCLNSETGEVMGHGLALRYSDLCYFSYENNGKEYFYAGLDSEASIKGTGIVEDGLLSGTYQMDVEGTPYGEFEVEALDTESLKEGIWKGTYHLNLDQFDYYDSGAFSNLDAVLTADGAEDGLTITLELIDEKNSLAAISIGGHLTEAREYPQEIDLKKKLNLNNEAQVYLYLVSADFDGLAETLEKAGATENFMELLDSGKEALLSEFN